MNQYIEWAAIFVPVSFLLIVGGLFPFRSYTGLKLGQAFFALAASVIAGAFSSYHRALALEPLLRSRYERENGNLEIYLAIAAAGLVYPLIVAFALRLWGRWIGGKATPAESEPGIAGIRAWFCASNIGVAVLLVDCAWYGYDVSPFLGAVIVAALLAAYPILRMESSAPAAAAAPVGEDLSAEREKIVSMLEAGKLTPEESAELLQALGESSRAPSRQVPLTGHQRLMLIGAALVALGFFLPWFVINPGKEMSHLFGQMQSAMSSAAGDQLPASLPGYPPQPAGYRAGYPSQIPTGDVSISGGDIQHGLGWAALALALAAALIPYVTTALDTHTARIIRLLCLGIGGVIVLYLLTQNLRFVGFGLIIAVSGYALEIAGAMRERRTTGA